MVLSKRPISRWFVWARRPGHCWLGILGSQHDAILNISSANTGNGNCSALCHHTTHELETVTSLPAGSLTPPVSHPSRDLDRHDQALAARKESRFNQHVGLILASNTRPPCLPHGMRWFGVEARITLIAALECIHPHLAPFTLSVVN